MKKLVVSVVVICIATFTSVAAESDIILRAQRDAAADGQKYHAHWWGVGGVAAAVVPVVMAAFFADALPVEARRLVALTAPPIGGASLALVGSFTGRAAAPDERLAEIRKDYDDPRLLSVYESEYEKALTKIQRRKRGNSVLNGFGASVGAMGTSFLVVYLTK